jgi:hypothetical protein
LNDEILHDAGIEWVDYFTVSKHNDSRKVKAELMFTVTNADFDLDDLSITFRIGGQEIELRRNQCD